MLLPKTALNYVIHFTPRVRSYIRGKGQMLTIPQAIRTLIEMQLAPSIESSEDTAPSSFSRLTAVKYFLKVKFQQRDSLLKI